MNKFDVPSKTEKLDGLYIGATYSFVIKEAGKKRYQKEGIYYGTAQLSCICVLSKSGEVNYYSKEDIVSCSLTEKQLDLPINKTIEVLEEYVQVEAEDGNVLLCAALDVAINILKEKAKDKVQSEDLALEDVSEIEK